MRQACLMNIVLLEKRVSRRIWLFYPILQLCQDIDGANDAPILGQYCCFSGSLSPLASLGTRLCEPIGYSRNAPVAILGGLSPQEQLPEWVDLSLLHIYISSANGRTICTGTETLSFTRFTLFASTRYSGFQHVLNYPYSALSLLACRSAKFSICEPTYKIQNLISAYLNS